MEPFLERTSSSRPRRSSVPAKFIFPQKKALTVAIPPSPLRSSIRPYPQATSSISAPFPVSVNGPSIKFLARRNPEYSEGRSLVSLPEPRLRCFPSIPSTLNAAQSSSLARIRSAGTGRTPVVQQSYGRYSHAAAEVNECTVVPVPSRQDQAEMNDAGHTKDRRPGATSKEGSPELYLHKLSDQTITDKQASGLQTSLRKFNWFQTFVTLQGAPALAQALVRVSCKGMSRQRGDHLLECELLLCLKEILNHEDAITDFLSHKSIVTQVASSLDSPHPITRKVVLKLLTFLAYKGGRAVTLVLEGLEALSTAHGESNSPFSYWFRSVEESLSWTMFGPGDLLEQYKQHALYVMFLVNGILKNVGDLSLRLRYRTRMNAAGLQRIREQFQAIDFDILNNHLQVLRGILDEDERELRRLNISFEEHTMQTDAVKSRKPISVDPNMPPREADDVVILLNRQISALEQKLELSLDAAAQLRKRLLLQKAAYEVRITLLKTSSIEQPTTRPEPQAAMKDRLGLQLNAPARQEVGMLSRSTHSIDTSQTPTKNASIHHTPKSYEPLTPRSPVREKVAASNGSEGLHYSSEERAADTDISGDHMLSNFSNPTDDSIISVMSMIEHTNFTWPGLYKPPVAAGQQ